MKAISLDSRICRDLSQALRKEWFETNGIGSVAFSTVACAQTRRSHGFLAVPPAQQNGIHSRDHYLLFSNLDETIFIDDVAYPLSTRLYEQTAFPDGHRHLSEFHLTPFPSWLFKIGDVVLMKSVIMVHGEETVLIRYQLLGGNEVLTRLELKPLMAERSAHSLQHRNPDFKPVLALTSGRVTLETSQNVPRLFFYHNAAIVDGAGTWYERVQYPGDRLNGLDCEEDLYAPFSLNYTFLRGLEVFFCVSARDKKEIHPELIIASEEDRRRKLARAVSHADARFQLLRRSAHSFLLRDASLASLPHDSPQLCDSMRETLLAFHGLLLVTGQLDHARRLLIDLGKQLKDDLPAMDIPLWFIHRVFEYLNYSDDIETIKNILFPMSQSIVESYKNGNSRFRMAPDGLISSVSAAQDHPLTWMDAKTGNVSVTPRKGKPVELQALWYNALCELAWIAGRLELISLQNSYEALAAQVKKSFHQAFWTEQAGESFLFDCVADEGKDASLRPNQLLALGLPFPVLEEAGGKWQSVLNLTKKHLLTPYGLRSLASREPDYCGHLEGDSQRCRRVIHQGAVWTWLLVPYTAAFLKANGHSKQSKEELFSFLNPLWKCLENECFGHISELFDGDAPHEARGSRVSASALGACLELYELLNDLGMPRKAAHTVTLR